jgi:hypothetical protein
MRTCASDGVFAVEPRSHPWTDAASDAACRYYDLKATPARIRTSLEDFVPWARYRAVSEFYALLEWLNGPASPFESNDCAFIAPHENDSADVDAELACSGRVMVLYRDLPLNVGRAEVERLENALHHALRALDPELERGIIGTTLVPVRYRALPKGEQLGHELMVSFWAWGDTKPELMRNLARVITSLFAALRSVMTPEA